MAAHITPLTKTIEVGDEFEQYSKSHPPRRVRVVRKIYCPDLSILFEVEQVRGSGRMVKTKITEKVLKSHYKRVQKTKRTLYRIKTREVFVGWEEVRGAA